MIVRRPLRIAAFACVAGLAGVACGGAGGGDDAVAPTPAVNSTPADSGVPAVPAPGAVESAPSAVVPASLQFTAPLIGGGEIVGDELAGKPTAFWFWSPT